ncbi:MAG: FAD-dependent thymidylate synthase [Thermodesulfobacteriota bacterium]|nr:FAD-dependent thymidylate synthase [Thermodesulfobacteriota bacterium]
MKVIEPHIDILHMPEGEKILKHLELAARTCYKSEDKIKNGSAAGLLKGLIKSGHHSILEHISITVRIVCDRGITHEIVRHRLCSFSQESTRYANYAKEKFGSEITVIRPFFWEPDSDEYRQWAAAIQATEKAYLNLIAKGASAQQARSVLPNSLKTEIIVTANIREWRHIFNLRCDRASHPQIRQIMLPLLDAFNERILVLFQDLRDKYREEIQGFINKAPINIT